METIGISFIIIILSPIAGFFFQFDWKEFRKEIFGVLGCLFIHFFLCYPIEDKESIAYLISLFYFVYCLLAFWTIDIKSKVLRKTLMILGALPMAIGYLGVITAGMYIIQMK